MEPSRRSNLPRQTCLVPSRSRSLIWGIFYSRSALASSPPTRAPRSHVIPPLASKSALDPPLASKSALDPSSCVKIRACLALEKPVEEAVDKQLKIWDAISFNSGMSSRLVIEKTIAMVEIDNWWLRMTIVMVEIIDWCRLVIENDDRYGPKNDWILRTRSLWSKQRLVMKNDDWKDRNIESRLVIENVGHWGWKYKLAIESWKGMETSGDQLWDNTRLLTSSSKSIFAPFWRKTWRRTGTRPLMKGREYSKNYSRKHLNFPHL